MNSPIKYFGGKGNSLSKTIISYFPDDYKEMNYFEGFGGSGAVLFRKDPSPVEVYNDLEENVYSLFKVLSTDELFQQFKHRCDLTPYSKQLNTEFKSSLKGDLDISERAYQFFIVNRSSYNGVGGFSDSNVIRRNMSKSVSDFLSTIDRLPEIHQRLSKVIVQNDDALKLIKKYDQPNWLHYLDPPYHHSTRTGARYKVDMGNDLQEEFLKTVISCQHAKIIISGYDCDEYGVLEENGWKRVDFNVKTQSGTRESKTKTESLWMNYN
jgi:DNA adenine methylase